MVELAASTALRGLVHVLDAGNSFSAFRAARYARRQTHLSSDVLERILVARAFTCYQVLTLLRQTPATADPKLIMGLLDTFTDENVSLDESLRLLQVVVGELDRLKRKASVAVSVSRPPQPSRSVLVEYLVQAADRVQYEEAPVARAPARLF